MDYRTRLEARRGMNPPTGLDQPRRMDARARLESRGGQCAQRASLCRAGEIRRANCSSKQSDDHQVRRRDKQTGRGFQAHVCASANAADQSQLPCDSVVKEPERTAKKLSQPFLGPRGKAFRLCRMMP